VARPRRSERSSDGNSEIGEAAIGSEAGAHLVHHVADGGAGIRVSASEGAAAATMAERSGTEYGEGGGGQGVAEAETGGHAEGLVETVGLDGRGGAKGGGVSRGSSPVESMRAL
jgi:hypothetical protein